VQELSRYESNNSNDVFPAQPSPSELWQNDPFAWSKPDDQPDLWTYWSVIWRHLVLILGLFAVAELLTMVVILTMTPLYTGLSTILIEHQGPQVLGNNTPAEDTESEASLESFYKTQYEILRSRSVAARVIHEMGLDHNRYLVDVPASGQEGTGRFGWLWPTKKTPTKYNASTEFGVKPEVIDAYLGNLTIRPQYGTRLIMVAFSSPDPTLSANVANAHVQAYILQASERHAQSSETEQRFLEKKLVELEKRIEKSESALNDYRRQRGIVVFSADDKDQIAGQRMADLNKALVQAATQRITLQADVESIKAQDYDSLPAVVNAVLVQNLKSEASKLEGQYASMANQYTPDWPPLAQLHAQLLQVQQREQEEIRKVVDSIKLRYKAALDQETKLQSELEAEKAKAMSLKDASLRDVILSREVDTNRALHQNVLERIKVLGVASESRVTNVSIVDSAEVPIRPSSPRKGLSVVLSGFLALLLGVTTAFAIEGKDQGLKNSEDVQRYLRLPILATVLHFASPGEKSLRARELPALPWRKAAQPSDEKEELPDRAMLSAAGDAYRTVRTAILLSRSGAPPKTVLITSAACGEGKSLTAINTAIVFAQMVDNVLLIDADLRQPRCHKALKRDSSPGLTEVLSGHEELSKAIQPTSIKGLYLLSAGLTPPNPTELLSSSKMRAILAAAGASFQTVLIDAAPILPVSDSVLLSRLVDGVVVVANARTARPLVRDACSRLIYAGAKVLGVVLNDVSPQHQRYSESYTYKSAQLDT
jgi:capsular exopolysaccharide synthesis family protein